MLISTAIYPNRLEDKTKLEKILNLQEFGNNDCKLYLPNTNLFAQGYERIVYGDHGPYIEFNKEQIKLKLFSKFGNDIDFDNLPDLNYKYYYYWLYPYSDNTIKVYLQIKPVSNLPNAPKRYDGKPSSFDRKEGYADYKRGMFYVDPYQLKVKI